MITFRFWGKIIILLFSCAIVLIFRSVREAPIFSAENIRPIVNFEDLYKNSPTNSSLTIAVYPCGGILPGIVANNGLTTDANSIYAKEENINVRFIIEEDPLFCFSILHEKKADIVWSKFSHFVCLYKKFQAINPVAIMAYGFSNGTIQIHSKRSIQHIHNLKNAAVACVPQSDSHLFLLFLLKENGIPLHSIKWYYVLSDADALSLFQKDKVDVVGISTHFSNYKYPETILITSHAAPTLFPELFIAREDVLIEKKELFIKFFSGWFKGLQQIEKNREHSLKLFAHAFGLNIQNAEFLVNSSIIAGTQENLEFFRLIKTAKQNIETLIEISTSVFNVAFDNIPPVMLVNNDILSSFVNNKKVQHAIEANISPSANVRIGKFASDVRITFANNNTNLDIDSLKMLERFAQKAHFFSKSKIVLIGEAPTNTQATYGYEWGMRFYAVKKFLTDYGIENTRIIIQNIVVDPSRVENNTASILCSLVP